MCPLADEEGFCAEGPCTPNKMQVIEKHYESQHVRREEKKSRSRTRGAWGYCTRLAEFAWVDKPGDKPG